MVNKRAKRAYRTYWRALGQTYQGAQRPADAHAAFQQVLEIYQRLGVD